MIYELKIFKMICDKCGTNRRIEDDAIYCVEEIAKKWNWYRPQVFDGLTKDDWHYESYCEYCAPEAMDRISKANIQIMARRI